MERDVLELTPAVLLRLRKAYEQALERDVLELTPAVLLRLRKAYEQALEMKQSQFTFEDHDLLTAYAGYLLEYADRKFADNTSPYREGFSVPLD